MPDATFKDPKPGTMLSRWLKKTKIKIDVLKLMARLFQLFSILFQMNTPNTEKKKALKAELREFLKEFNNAPLFYLVNRVRKVMDKVELGALDDLQEEALKDALIEQLYQDLDEVVDKFIDNSFDEPNI